jgi:hypothetical protein
MNAYMVMIGLSAWFGFLFFYPLLIPLGGGKFAAKLWLYAVIVGWIAMGLMLALAMTPFVVTVVAFWAIVFLWQFLRRRSL